MFLSAICERLKDSEDTTIIVGLEYPQVEFEDLLRYVNSSGSTKDKEQHLESPHLILVGNLHSRRTVGRFNDAEFRPMLHWIESENISVNIFSRHGDYWACTVDGCGRRSLPGEPEEFGTLKTAMPRFDSSAHHDHSIVFDRFTASPPAVRRERGIGN